MEDLRKCCFCGKTVHFLKSHNPSPADTRDESRCCLECNYRIVLPARVIIDSLIKTGIAGKQAKTINVPDYTPLLKFNQMVETGEFIPQVGDRYDYRTGRWIVTE